MKTCAKCGALKDYAACGRSKQNKTGRRSRCLVCEREDYRNRYHADIERSRAIARAKAERHKEQRSAYMKEYNADAGKAVRSNYVAAHRAEVNANSLRSYYREHDRNRGRVLRSSHRTRARYTGGGVIVPYTTDQLLDRFEMFGNRCWLCGTDEGIQVDHVKPLSRGGPECLSNVRPICGSCNKRKSNEWPFDPNSFRNRHFRAR